MSQISIAKLLEPISGEKPCGEILAEEPEFHILKNMINGKEETQWSPYEPPDWKNILRLSKKMLLMGKDIWGVVIFTYASINLSGLEGMNQGLGLLKGMLETFWDTIQPELEPEGEDDFTLSRLSPLATMSSPNEHLCIALKTIPFIQTRRLGQFSFDDIAVLADETAVREKRLEDVEIERIADDLDKDKYNETIAAIKESKKICGEINDFITEKVGKENNLSQLENLVGFFENMIKTFTKCDSENAEKTEQSVANIPEKSTTDNSNRRSVKISGNRTLNSRIDVINHLKELTKWYKKFDQISMDLFLLESFINSMEADTFAASMKYLRGIADEIYKVLGVSPQAITNTKQQSSKKNFKAQESNESEEDDDSDEILQHEDGKGKSGYAKDTLSETRSVF